MVSSPTAESLMVTPVRYGEIIRPIAIGVVLSFSLWGIGLAQFYHCFKILRRFHNTQNNKLKAFELSALLLLDMTDSMAKVIWFDRFLRDVTLRGLTGFVRPDRLIIVLLVTTPLITCTSHILYARRIHVFKKREGSRHIHFWSISLAVVVALSVTHVVAAVFTCYIFITKPSDQWIPTMIPSASLQLGGSAFVDCLFALFFMLAFKKHLRSTNFSATTDLILRLIQFGVGANLLTSILQILELILFLASPDTAYHFAVLIFISKTYIIGLLAVVTQARAWSSSSHDNGSIGIPNNRIQHNTSTEPNFVEMALRVQTGRKFATETQGSEPTINDY